MKFTIIWTILTAGLVPMGTALYTPKGSACAVQCGTKAQNFTGTADLVCLDTAYQDNSKGVLLKGCISCLSDSTFVNSTASYNGNSDQYWFLWHIKYVQQYCLVDTPQTTAASNCASKCEPMKTALDVSWIYNHAGIQPQYGYCSWNSSQYMTYAEDCGSCLQGEEGGVAIGNFVDTTFNACKSQPLAQSGGMVRTSRELFNYTLVDAKASDATISTQPTSTSTIDTADTTTSMSSGLSIAALAGIGVGVAVVVLAIAGGVFIMIRRRKSKSVQLSPKSVPIFNESQELDTNTQINEIEGAEKSWNHISNANYKALPPQELDSHLR